MKPPLFLIFLFTIFFSSWQVNKCSAQSTIPDPHDQEWQSKLMAQEVLQSKCNNCHRLRNPNKIFTIDNMDSYAQKIYDQVFLLKRMPKGEKRRGKMTKEELLSLENWLNITISNNN